MMIRKECLGVSFSKKSPHNGCHFSGVITDNPENFALYKVLQLDVFESNIPPMANVELTTEQFVDSYIEELESKKPKSKKKKD
jgi:hypothetical protein